MDAPVDLSWAMKRCVMAVSSQEDWWWREFVLGSHFGEPVTMGFVADCRTAYAMYLGTDVLLLHPTVREAETILDVFRSSQSREATSDGV